MTTFVKRKSSIVGAFGYVADSVLLCAKRCLQHRKFVLLAICLFFLCLFIVILQIELPILFVSLLVFFCLCLYLFGIQVGLYVILFFSVGGHWLQFYLPSSITSLGFWSYDIILMGVYIVWLVNLLATKEAIISTNLSKYLIYAIAILSLPIGVGLLRGHYLTTVLRESRAPFYYVLPLVFATTIHSTRNWLRFVKILFIVVTLCMLLFLCMYLFNVRFPVSMGVMENADITAGEYTRAYGIASSWFYFPLCVFIAIKYLGAKASLSFSRRLLAYVLVFLFSFSVMILLIRSLFFSLVFGILACIVTNAKGIYSAILKLAILCVFVLTLVPFFSAKSVYGFLHHPLVERYVSFFAPGFSTAGNLANIQYRKNAITWGLRTVREYGIIGKGYGDAEITKDVGVHIRYTGVGFQNHSTIGWALARLGPIMISLLVIVIILSVRRCGVIYKQISDVRIRAVLGGLFVFCVSLLIMMPATNVLFRGDFYTLLVTIVLGLILSAESFSSEYLSQG